MTEIHPLCISLLLFQVSFPRLRFAFRTLSRLIGLRWNMCCLLIIIDKCCVSSKWYSPFCFTTIGPVREKTSFEVNTEPSALWSKPSYQCGSSRMILNCTLTITVWRVRVSPGQEPSFHHVFQRYRKIISFQSSVLCQVIKPFSKSLFLSLIYFFVDNGCNHNNLKLCLQTVPLVCLCEWAVLAWWRLLFLPLWHDQFQFLQLGTFS